MKAHSFGVFLGLLCLLGLFTGCAGEEAVETAAFALDKDQETAYTQEITQTLSDYYWGYDASTLDFAEGQVTDDPEALAASERCGYPLADYAQKDCIVATISLLYASNEIAGTGTFYFHDDELWGFWYASPQGAYSAYSLLDRNLYPAGQVPDRLESDTAYTDGFTAYPVSLPAEAQVVDIATDENGRLLACLLRETELEVYMLENHAFVPLASLSWPEERPITAAFLRDGTLAVLLGTYVGDETQEAGRVIASQVAFYALTAAGEEEEAAEEEETTSVLPEALVSTYPALAADNCTGLAALDTADGTGLLLFSNDSLKQYSLGPEGAQLISRQYLGHSVISMATGDLTGDGQQEYFFVSGLDCYLYRMEGEEFDLTWQTHVNGAFFQGPAWMGDLNRDGVLELYLTDAYGSAIRYTLGERGLVTQNQDIDYGEILVVADLNADGFSDYVERNNDGTSTLYLYTAQEAGHE